jgi:hypothetical protein
MYPRLHLATDGRAFLAGPLATTQWLETTDRGNWTVVGNRRSNQFYEYAPTVMYIPGKVIYIGGGDPPVKTCEKIDLTQGEPAWELTDPMAFARRHHNATILPDGTVLVTGGTQGDGFNNLTVGKPIRAAEVWNPVTGKWATLAEESVDRCYHSAAVLLPDGRVLSTGGGEYRPNGVDPNPPEDSHRDAQIFSPPYLFRGARPVIVAAPAVVEFGKPIEITTPDAAAVARVTLVRLSSATHSCNMNQRFNELMFVMAAGKVTATAPDKPNSCPPGHYLLTILNTAGVPSVSKILRIK